MANASLSSRSPRRRTSVRVPKKRGGKVVRRSLFSRSHTMPMLQNADAIAMDTTTTPTKAGPGPAAALPQTPARPAEGQRKRHVMWSLKPKDRPQSSQTFMAGEASPVRSGPVTPKAAQVLGVDFRGGLPEDSQDDVSMARPSHDASDGDDEGAGQAQVDGGEDENRSGLRVKRPALRKRASESILTAFKGRSRNDEVEHVDSPTSAHSGLLKKTNKNKKAMRMLDLIPSFSPRGKNAPPMAPLRASPLVSPLIERDTSYSSDSSMRTRSQPAQSKQKAQRKKHGKSLETMSPITENSHSESGSVVFDEDADLNTVYATYAAHGASYSSSSFSRSVTTPDMRKVQSSRYELDQDELSDVEEDQDDQDHDEDHDQPIFGTVPNYHFPGWTAGRRNYQVHGPLQKIEQQLLDRTEKTTQKKDKAGSLDQTEETIQKKVELVTEETMQAELLSLNEIKATQQKNEARFKTMQENAELLRLDEEKRKNKLMADEAEVFETRIWKMQDDQKKLKRDFRKLRNHSSFQDRPVSPPTDDDGLCSISSSIDTDEEPEVFEAEACRFQSITKVTPGMVKVIDIPPRKQKATAVPVKETVPAQPTPIYLFKDDDLMGFAKEDIDTPVTAPPVFEHAHHTEKLEPFPEYVDKYAHFTREKKDTLPRDESRQLVQTWVRQYNNTEQRRPSSVRYDADVQADRQLPPAPVLKDHPSPMIQSYSPLMRQGFSAVSQSGPPPKKGGLDPASPSRSLFLNQGPRSPPPAIPLRSPFRTPTKMPPQKPAKNHCVHIGHIFRPINLKDVPDQAALGTLGVSPYLQTSTGVKQHVHVPVMCDVCNEDVGEVLWECQVPVCGMALCYDCAAAKREDMRGDMEDGQKFEQLRL